MMNKYQEALDNLIRVSCPRKVSCKECDFEKSCNSQAKGYLPFTEANSILTQLINEHFEVIKEKESLEKALDKACELISSDVCINCYDCQFDKYCNNECIANNMTKEEWKEWCLKDVD